MCIRDRATGVGHVPAWMVIDQRYRNRYLFAGLSPSYIACTAST